MVRGRNLYVLVIEPLVTYAAYLVVAFPLTSFIVAQNWAAWWIAPVFAGLYYGTVRLVKYTPLPRPHTPGLLSDQFRALDSREQQAIVWTVQRTLIPFGLIIGTGLAYLTITALDTAVTFNAFEALSHTLVILFASGLTGMWVMDRIVHQYVPTLPAEWTRPLDTRGNNTE